MLVPEIDNLKKEVSTSFNEKLISDINDPVEIYDTLITDDEKTRKSLVMSIEKIVRTSPEYGEYIGYLKNNLELTKCTFHKDVDISVLKKTKIEFHHYPFTLYDITDTVLEKYMEDHSVVNPFEVACEVMKLHFELKVGLVPLSKTVHKLAHNGKKFINLKLVNGHYLRFISEYSKYINPELIANWGNLKNLSALEDEGELEENILDKIPMHIKMEDVEDPVEIVIESEINSIA